MSHELKIVMDDNGQVSVSGPIQNKILAYGLLEVARDAIHEHSEQSKSLIQPVSVLPKLQ